MFSVWFEFQHCQNITFFSRLAATFQVLPSKIQGKCQKADSQNTYQGLLQAPQRQAQQCQTLVDVEVTRAAPTALLCGVPRAGQPAPSPTHPILPSLGQWLSLIMCFWCPAPRDSQRRNCATSGVLEGVRTGKVTSAITLSFRCIITSCL